MILFREAGCSYVLGKFQPGQVWDELPSYSLIRFARAITKIKIFGQLIPNCPALYTIISTNLLDAKPTMHTNYIRHSFSLAPQEIERL